VIINFASAPPINLRLNKKNVIKNNKHIIKNLTITKDLIELEYKIKSIELEKKITKQIYLKKMFGILRYFRS
jgi:hypothetical protein